MSVRCRPDCLSDYYSYHIPGCVSDYYSYNIPGCVSGGTDSHHIPEITRRTDGDAFQRSRLHGYAYGVNSVYAHRRK